MLSQRGQIVGIVIHIVPVVGLAGTPMASSIMRYDSVSVIQEEHHLRIPVVGR